MRDEKGLTVGSIRRKTYTKPLPADAELFTRKGQRMARWKVGSKSRTAPVTTGKDGSPRIVETAKTFTAKYRNAENLVVEVATGCKDKAAAEQRLAELERQADRIRAGVLTSTEEKAVSRQQTPIAEHIEAYLSHLEAAETTPEHRANVRRCLYRIVNDCEFAKLADIVREPVEAWLLARAKEGMGARTRNTYRSAIHAFCNWCADPSSPRLLSNPLVGLPRADEAADPRHQRRSLTADELRNLLFVARWRPLAEYGRTTVRRKKANAKGRRTWTKAPLTFDTIEEAVDRARDRLRGNPEFAHKLDSLGLERALIYKTLFSTGLRKGELDSLSVGQLEIDAEPAYLTLDAADEKNREGNSIPLRSDLASDLRAWLDGKAEALQRDASEAPTVKFDPEAAKRAQNATGDTRGPDGRTCHGWATLPKVTPVFRVPRDLFKILYRDLAVAGISKQDAQGRYVDVHALRHSYGSHLGKAGVAPRTAQAAMRHSDPKLTANIYQDPRILDLAGAVELLPNLPLDGGADQDAARATGTEGRAAGPLAPMLAPMLAPKPANQGQAETFLTTEVTEPEELATVKKQKNPKETSVFPGIRQERARGFEPPTYSLGSCHSAN